MRAMAGKGKRPALPAKRNQEPVVSEERLPVRKGKGGRPPILVSEEAKKKILYGIRLGIPIERLRAIAIPSNSPGAWSNFLRLNPDFVDAMEAAKGEGELELAMRVHSSEQGWQGAAWLLERARGYVARASLEHTGKGGSQLTIAHQLLSAVGEKEK